MHPFQRKTMQKKQTEQGKGGRSVENDSLGWEVESEQSLLCARPIHQRICQVRDVRFPTDTMKKATRNVGEGIAKEGFRERFLPSKTGAFMLFILRHALHRAESTTGLGPGPPTCPFEFGIIWDTFLVGVHPISIQHRCTAPSRRPLPRASLPQAVYRTKRSDYSRLLPNSLDIFAHVERRMI